jgi:hypothetical protein
VAVTGSGYSGSQVPLVVSFVSADGRRKYLEMHAAPVSGGAISYDVPAPFTSGTVVVKQVNATGVVQVTSSNQAV